MKIYKREENRNSNKVTSDVSESKKIVREDVYEIIKDSKTRSEALKVLEAWLRTLPEEVYKNKEIDIARVLSDIDSYMEWDEHDQDKGNPRRRGVALKKG